MAESIIIPGLGLLSGWNGVLSVWLYQTEPIRGDHL